jgi:hypothetical protein
MSVSSLTSYIIVNSFRKTFTIQAIYSDHENTRLQSTSENQTVVGFRIQFCARPGHLKTGPFEIRTKMYGFWMVKTRPFYYKENICFTLLFIKRCRLVDHLKSGQIVSGFQMVKKQDGWHNLAANLFLPFEIRTKKSRFWMVGASLDRFINKSHKNILFMPKWSRLAESETGTLKVSKKWPFEIRTVRIPDVDCIPDFGSWKCVLW